MPYINGMMVDDVSGRVVFPVTPPGPTSPFNGGFAYNPATNARLRVNSAGVSDAAINGFGVENNGSQNSEPVLPSGDDTRINGVRVSTDGLSQVSVSTLAPIAFYCQGWPVSVNGELCIV